MAQHGHPLALVDLLAALLAGALWYAWPALGPAPLLLVALGLVVRHLVEPQPEFELTALDAAVGLFLVSAGIGLLIAYDWDAAAAKFWVILGGVAIYGALVRAPAEIDLGRRVVKPLDLLLGSLPTIIAAYFVVTADYSRLIGKLPLLDELFAWITSWQPSLPGDELNANVAGGLIAGLLPLQAHVLSVWHASAPRSGEGQDDQTLAPRLVKRSSGEGHLYSVSWRTRGIKAALLVVSGLGLVLSASRGAWLALAVVTAGFALLRWLQPRRTERNAAAGLTALMLVMVLAGAPGALAERPHLSSLWGASDYATQEATQVPTPARPAQDAPQPLIASAAAGRADLLGDSLALARDYAFTGLGLGGFPMAFSSYVLLVHVGHTNHSHNLFVDIWLEQGLLGLVAFLWLLGAAFVAWRRVRRIGSAQGQAWAGAAFAAIGVIVLHGLVDDSFYASRGVLWLLVPFALLTRTQADAVWSGEEPPTLTEVLVSRNGILAASTLAIALLVGVLPPVRSQVQANLGALAQTRAELAVYEWPAWPIQDALRRSSEIDLEPALARYAKAIALNRENATANRRLGQIALSRGDYPVAGPSLVIAFRNDYTNRAARQLYGEWLAVEGRTQEAAAIWRTVDLSQGQLDGRTWWYAHIGEPEKTAALRAAEKSAGN